MENNKNNEMLTIKLEALLVATGKLLAAEKYNHAFTLINIALDLIRGDR